MHSQFSRQIYFSPKQNGAEHTPYSDSWHMAIYGEESDPLMSVIANGLVSIAKLIFEPRLCHLPSQFPS
jgi:hypothetical protein